MATLDKHDIAVIVAKLVNEESENSKWNNHATSPSALPASTAESGWFSQVDPALTVTPNSLALAQPEKTLVPTSGTRSDDSRPLEDGFDEEDAVSHIINLVGHVDRKLVSSYVQERITKKEKIEPTRLDSDAIARIVNETNYYRQIEQIMRGPIIHRVMKRGGVTAVIGSSLSRAAGFHERMSLDLFLRYAYSVQETIDQHTGSCKLDYDFKMPDDSAVYNNRDSVLMFMRRRKPITQFTGTITLCNDIVEAKVDNLSPYGLVPLYKIPGLNRLEPLKGKYLRLPTASENHPLLGVMRYSSSVLGVAATLGLVVAGSMFGVALAPATAAYLAATSEWARSHNVGALTEVKPKSESSRNYTAMDVTNVKNMMNNLRNNTITLI